MAASTFQKGQEVWYKTKDGGFVEAKVASVDLSIRPVSYGIYLKGSDNLRETESPRLKPRKTGQTAPVEHDTRLKEGSARDMSAKNKDVLESSNGIALSRTNEERETGKENGSHNPDIDWSAIKRRPHTMAAAFRSSKPAQQPQKPGGRQNTVKTAFSPPPDEDDFGEFSGADMEPETSESPQLSAEGHQQTPPCRRGPIPLSAFGEEDEDELQLGESAGPLIGQWHTFPHPASRLHPTTQHQPHTTQGTAQSYPYMAQAPPPEDRGMPLQGLKPALASQLFPARRIVHLASEDQHTQSADDFRRQLPKGASPKSTAAQSDDFGDFEEAEVNLQNDTGHREAEHAQDLHEWPVAMQQPNVNSYPAQRSLSAAPPVKSDYVPANSWEIGAGQPGNGHAEGWKEEDEEEEVPWYLDIGAQLPSHTQPQTSADFYQPHHYTEARPSSDLPAYFQQGGFTEAQGRPQLAQSGPPPAQRLYLREEPPKSAPLADPPAVSSPEFNPESHCKRTGAMLNKDLSSPGIATASLPLPLLQAMNGVPDPQVAAEPNRTLSDVRGSASMPLHPLTEAEVFSEAQAARPREILRLEDLEASRVLQSGVEQIGPPCSYSEAWTQMMEVCAAELERGYAILQREAQLSPHLRRLTGSRGKDYLRALGQLYLSSLLLQAAMETHVQQQHRPSAFQNHAHRCSRAWCQGPEGYSLEEAVFRVAPQMPRHVESLPRQLISALSEAPQWQQLRQQQERQWQAGLCGISLLPLDQLEELHVATWADERPCLVLLANLWTNKVNSRAPHLQGWAI